MYVSMYVLYVLCVWMSICVSMCLCVYVHYMYLLQCRILWMLLALMYNYYILRWCTYIACLMYFDKEMVWYVTIIIIIVTKWMYACCSTDLTLNEQL